MRSAMPHPCIGSSARVFRISRSSVPCSRSVGLPIGLGGEPVWWSPLLSMIESKHTRSTLDRQEKETVRPSDVVERQRARRRAIDVSEAVLPGQVRHDLDLAGMTKDVAVGGQ